MIQIVNKWSLLPIEVKKSLIEASVFYSQAYERFLRKENEVIYLFDESFVQVVGIHIVASFFKYASFPVEPFRYQESKECLSEKNFLNNVIVELKKMGVCWVPVTPASSVFLSYPDSATYIPWGNYIIDLSLDEEQLFKNVSSKHRNMIRKGEKSLIEIKYGAHDLLADYTKLDSMTWERSGVKANNEHIYRDYLDNLPNNSIIGIAYKDGEPQCGLLGLYSSGCFYYEFGASAHRPEPGSTHYLQWQTILKMKAAGVRKYSFVGCRIDVDKDSKLGNIQHFKAGFGGELINSYLFKCDIIKWKVLLFKCLLFLRSGKYPKDAIDQEKKKWPNLN